ncbi:hypothetical protein [Streptomyces sp. NPDC014806]|uniref:hypothetical protein n=1 Tax=Streptomyces sp. NPDC014806 TaxID=3364920 RepID=UPI0036FCCBE1
MGVARTERATWWLADRPDEVFGYGRLAFYGPEVSGRRAGRRVRARLGCRVTFNGSAGRLELEESRR